MVVKKLTHNLLFERSSFCNVYSDYLRFFGIKNNRKKSMALLNELIKESWMEGIYIEMKSEIIGFCIFSKTYSPVKYVRAFSIDDIYVISKYRNKGIGTLLLSELCKYAGSMKVKKLYTNTDVNNKKMNGFYNKNGFYDGDASILHKDIK